MWFTVYYYYCRSPSATKIISNIKFRDPENTATISISILLTKTNAPYDIGNLSNDYSQTKTLAAANSQSEKRKSTVRDIHFLIVDWIIYPISTILFQIGAKCEDLPSAAFVHPQFIIS